MLTIHPPSFIETEDCGDNCGGIRYTRGQPSRENPGVLMSDIQNKYITEFELPYRNIERYIKEVGNNWNRLNDEQKNLIKTSFQNMGLIGKVEQKKENFAEVSSQEIGVPGPIDPNISNFIKYLSNDSINTSKFMDALWNTTPEQTQQLGLTNNQLSNIRDNMYSWSVDNTYVLHSNWKSGLILFFFILLIIILIIVAAASGNTGGNSFGKSLFGKRH